MDLFHFCSESFKYKLEIWLHSYAQDEVTKLVEDFYRAQEGDHTRYTSSHLETDQRRDNVFLISFLFVSSLF